MRLSSSTLIFKTCLVEFFKFPTQSKNSNDSLDGIPPSSGNLSSLPFPLRKQSSVNWTSLHYIVIANFPETRVASRNGDQFGRLRLIVSVVRWPYSCENYQKRPCFYAGIIAFTLQQQNMAEGWREFAEYFELSPTLGYLIDPSVPLQTMDAELLQRTLEDVSNAEDLTILEKAKQFRCEGLEKLASQREAFAVHSLAIAIISKMFALQRKEGISDAQMRVPANLAAPLFHCSTMLGLRLGMNAYIGSLWRPTCDHYLREDDSFGFGSFEMRMYLTPNHHQELFFFGGSIVAAFYLTRMNRMAFEMSELIRQGGDIQTEMVSRLEKCAHIWDRIVQENDVINREFSPDYFYNELRPRIGPFNGVTFEGAVNGEDVVASCVGGTAGCDPSFQLFEKFFGLHFEGPYERVQKSLQTGMTAQHRLMLNFVESNKNVSIRQYCTRDPVLKEKYNLVLKAYVRFQVMHSHFVENFILKPIMKVNPESKNENDKGHGTAGTSIKHHMERYVQVENQLL